MLSKKVEEALNEQILMEGASSNFYLAMAVWEIGRASCRERV